MPRGNTIPKTPDTRARRNKPAELRVIAALPVPQPPLPDGAWSSRTVEWWKMWGESPLAAEFTATDWSELMDTAVVHSAFWAGDLKQAGELRLRVAKFGATPEDRARLKITFAAANEAEEKQGTRQASRARYGDLKLA